MPPAESAATLAEGAPARRRRTRWVRWTALALTLAAGLSLLATYGLYREWPWSAYPGQLSACGRDFIQQGPTQTQPQLAADGTHLHRVGGTPGWLTRGELWTTAGGQPLTKHASCKVVMWVTDDDRHFMAYSLSGGP
jgi:hypothetical protein